MLTHAKLQIQIALWGLVAYLEVTVTSELLLSSWNMSSPSQVLRLSQQAPSLLQKPSPHTAAFRPTHLTSTENAEDWIQLEQLFLSCLQTGNDQSAHLFLERLIDRFGTSNERVLSLHGLYREAVAEDDAALARILKDYDDLLAEDPSIIVRVHRSISTFSRRRG